MKNISIQMPDFNHIDWKSPIIIISLISLVISLIYWWFFPSLVIYGAIGNNGNGIGVFLSELILYSFLHGGFLHLVSNVLFFITIGRIVELSHGKQWTWYLWVWTTLFVGVFLYNFSEDPTIGGSGFALSLLTVYAYDLYKHKHSDYKGAVLLIAINLIIGWGATVSFMGHFAGAVAGLIFVWFMSKRVPAHHLPFSR